MKHNATEVGAEAPTRGGRVDAVVVGAGFAGLYMLYRLRQLGMRVRVFDAAGDVGGTWYWNRYPGARCDVESLLYSYSFSKELAEEWTWSERFPAQPEILSYLNHVADRFDLRREITFDTRIESAVFDAADNGWTVTTDRDEVVTATYCIMATGCLSTGRLPDIPGLDRFQGKWYHTGSWPHEEVNFRGQKVAVIGTGSSGIQVIPVVAKVASHLYVFQRTPSFSVPARNAPLTPGFIREFLDNYDELRQQARLGVLFGSGDLGLTEKERAPIAPSGMMIDEEQRRQEFERRWERGGAYFMATFPDQMVSPEVNEAACEFIRSKIHEIVKDPETADRLSPKGFPVGSKRICLDTEYYQTFNRQNVTLVDAKATPIEEIIPTGLRTTSGDYEIDSIIFATGFDAMTGALLRMDIRGVGGLSLRDKWRGGPRTYLGLSVAGFPNLFVVTGPGSPSVISNVVVSIEQHVEWISSLIETARARGISRIEAAPEAEDEWVRHVSEVADATLFPVADSWFVGANVPGKPRIFMPYVGGVGAYRRICDDVAANGYRGFRLDGIAGGEALTG